VVELKPDALDSARHAADDVRSRRRHSTAMTGRGVEPFLCALPEDPVRALLEIVRYGIKELQYGPYLKGVSPKRRDAVQALRDQLADTWARELIQQGRDPVDAMLDEVSRIASPSASEQVRRVQQWQRLEVPLNTRLRLVFALVPAKVGGRLVRACLDERTAPFPPLRVVRVGQYKTVGKPDLVLQGPDTLVMVEMKVRGATARHTYGPDQLLNYLALARRARLGRCVHLILGPPATTNPFRQRDRWIASLDSATGRVIIDPDGLRRTVRRPRRWAVELARTEGMAALRRTLHEVPILRRSYGDVQAAWERVVGTRASGSTGLAGQVLQRLVEYAGSTGGR
jgi:hypothetical protein